MAADLLNSWVPSSAHIVGGQFNTAPPTPLPGQFLPLQQDSAGNLLVNVATFTGTVSTTNPSVGLTGATAPTSATEIGVVDNTGKLQHVTGLVLTNAISATVAIVDANGNQITSFGGGSQFAMGSAQSSSALGTIALGYDGTNVRGLLVSSTGQLHTIIDSATLGTVTVTGTVTANQGAPNTAANSWPVEVTDGTNILGTSSHPVRIDPTGTTTQPVSGSVSVSNFPATQNIAGVTTDGTTTETNFLVVGGESNDATAQYQPIPLGTTGRSVIIEGVAGGTAVPISGSVSVSNFPATQPVSGTVTANQGTPNSLANKWPVQVTDGTNTMPTGDVVARAIFHQITDGTNGPVAVKAASTAAVAADPALVITPSPNGRFRTADGAGNPLTTSSPSTGVGVNPLDSNLISVRGTQFTQAGYVDIKVSDGTNGTAAVKAASTRAVATDPSFVVALSPNSPVAMQLSGGGVGPVTGTALTNLNAVAAMVVDGTGTQIGYSVTHPFVDELTDGINGPVAVKPASTAAFVTDPALVVTISPNSQDTRGLTDLLQTLILETRAMRSALVYMITENGDVRDSDFDPASQDFQPVN